MGESGSNAAPMRVFAPWREELACMDGASDGYGVAERMAGLFWEIDAIGHDEKADAGYDRFAWTAEDAWLRLWFAAHARRLGLEVRVDAAGNQWALWVPEGVDAEARMVVVGSHLDSVPGGGAFDGPLGVISALVAIEDLRSSGWVPACPVAVVNFHDEEGARFSVACLGSRVVTGVMDPERVSALTDAEGVSVDRALSSFGSLLDLACREAAGSRALGAFDDDEIALARTASAAPACLGSDDRLVARIGAMVELHVEQGCALGDMDAPLAVAGSIWPHGRWRVDIGGESNHAGTTPMDRRSDPVVALSRLVLAVREEAIARGARATVGRIEVVPNGVNVVASAVRCWIDCRAQTEDGVRAVISGVGDRARTGELAAGQAGVSVTIREESQTPATRFSADLRHVLETGGATALGAPALPSVDTGAGHDAGVLQEAGVPCGMLFVRNRTGVSHAPGEFASLRDCVTGVMGLKGALRAVAQAVCSGKIPPRPHGADVQWKDDAS